MGPPTIQNLSPRLAFRLLNLLANISTLIYKILGCNTDKRNFVYNLHSCFTVASRKPAGQIYRLGLSVCNFLLRLNSCRRTA